MLVLDDVSEEIVSEHCVFELTLLMLHLSIVDLKPPRIDSRCQIEADPEQGGL